MGEILGRFHPLLVHMPIGILSIAFLMELCSRSKRFDYLRKAMPFILTITALSAIGSFFTGWIMPKEGAFDESLVRFHFWTALALTVSTLLLLLLHQTSNTFFKKLYFPLFVLAMGLLVATGHYGGSLTHGSDFLTKPLSNKVSLSDLDPDSLQIYTHLIAPIFEKKCISCHNEGKLKGGLLMTDHQAFLKGGETGAAFIPKDGKNSLLVKRMHLVSSDEKHMPPKGKVQLTDEEIELITWWIQEDGQFESYAKNINQSPKIKSIIDNRLKGEGANLAPLEAGTLAALAAKNITVLPLSLNSPDAQVSLTRSDGLNKKQLKALSEIEEYITELNLSKSNFDDALARYLPELPRLKKLKLQSTAFSSAGLKYIKQYHQLELLNLFNTEVGDEIFNTLTNFTALKEVYLWQTNVSKSAVIQFQKDHPEVKVNYNIKEAIFADAQLAAPRIIADQDIFTDSLSLSLEVNLIGAKIYYTLDGTAPDTSANLYTRPILLRQTTQVRAVTTKKDWINSPTSERVITKSGIPIAAIQLSRPPNKKYAADGPETLKDLQNGTVDFAKGAWLGYEAEDVVIDIDLGTSKPVENVLLSSMEAPNSYIFYPSAIELSVSEDNKTFTKVHHLTIPTATETHAPTIKFLLLNLGSSISARYLKLSVNSLMENPAWHPAPGAKCWLFIDEVMVN